MIYLQRVFSVEKKNIHIGSSDQLVIYARYIISIICCYIFQRYRYIINFNYFVFVFQFTFIETTTNNNNNNNRSIDKLSAKADNKQEISYTNRTPPTPPKPIYHSNRGKYFLHMLSYFNNSVIRLEQSFRLRCGAYGN